MKYDKMLCVVPARMWSKRLPKKNIKLLNGKPMVLYTIEAALQTNIFNEVYLSTESDEIAGICKQTGCQIHKRSNELAGDFVTNVDVCLDLFEATKHKGYEDVICLQPTSPLRSDEDIIMAVEKYYAANANFLVSTTLIDPHFFHWALKEDKYNLFTLYFGMENMKQRQLLEPVYRPNGAIKIAKITKLKVNGNFFGDKLTVFNMPEERSIHVAHEFDLNLCQYLLQKD